MQKASHPGFGIKSPTFREVRYAQRRARAFIRLLDIFDICSRENISIEELPIYWGRFGLPHALRHGAPTWPWEQAKRWANQGRRERKQLAWQRRRWAQ
jgi:hypothetical protein